MKNTISIFLALFIFIFIFNASAQQNKSFQVGQQVEAYNVGWYKATVLEIGSGNYAGYFKVHYNDFSSASDQYISATNIRIVKKVVASNMTAGPRNGRYIIMAYGRGNPLTLGYFDLNNGKYILYDAGISPTGKGTYVYDQTKNMVIWKSGSLMKYNATAAFEISREGKTHSIRLRSTTYGFNSTD